MIKPTDKGQPLNGDSFMASIQGDERTVVGRAWIEDGKWHFISSSIPDNTVYEVDKEDILITFGIKMKEPRYT